MNLMGDGPFTGAILTLRLGLLGHGPFWLGEGGVIPIRASTSEHLMVFRSSNPLLAPHRRSV